MTLPKGSDDPASGLTQRWAADFLRYEGGLAVLVAAAVAAYGEVLDPEGLIHFVSDHKADLYTVTASIDGALLGFVITTTSIILTFAGSDRMKIVRESKHYQYLWKTFVAAMRVLAVATVVTLVALVLDGSDLTQRIAFYLWLMVSMLAAARVARCIWILKWVIDLVTTSRARPAGK